MKHLGDITKIHGYEAPIVDVVIGGSPCQDLSVAGKRAGLAGERSGLFMEQLRVIKEMREHDIRSGRPVQFVRPRHMLWENVPGATNTNKGEDFRVVLEETARVADKDAVIPQPPNGKWTTAGCIMGDGWSIAWRVLNAQLFGLPQRRRRIALVADFGGQSAPEILFERKGLHGDFDESGVRRERAAADDKGYAGESSTTIASEGSGDKKVLVLNDQGGRVMSVTENVVGTLRAQEHGHQPIVFVMNIARRITPLEAERLNGFPDYWTDIGEYTDTNGKKRKTSDSARYKALGNSIALPPWKWILKRISAQYERDATMASLFDGIGGFPLLWEQINGKGSCLWASEIEEFAIAVTKRRIG